MDRVEYRIDGGAWSETTYSSTPSEIGALTPFLWHVILDPMKMTSGEHTVEIHAVSGALHSLPVFFDFNVTKSDSSQSILPPIILGVSALVALGWVSSIAITRSASPLALIPIIEDLRNKRNQVANSGVMEAEIIEPYLDG